MIFSWLTGWSLYWQVTYKLTALTRDCLHRSGCTTIVKGCSWPSCYHYQWSQHVDHWTSVSTMNSHSWVWCGNQELWRSHHPALFSGLSHRQYLQYAILQAISSRTGGGDDLEMRLAIIPPHTPTYMYIALNNEGTSLAIAIHTPWCKRVKLVSLLSVVKNQLGKQLVNYWRY